MVKQICDRCEREIKGNFWTVNIYEHPDKFGNNIHQNLNKKEFCKSCIDEIKKTIEKIVI